jgi:hypothetical protein
VVSVLALTVNMSPLTWMRHASQWITRMTLWSISVGFPKLLGSVQPSRVMCI